MSHTYPLRLFCTQDGDSIEWVVEYPDLPGCIGVGETQEEALCEGEINKKLWIETAMLNGEAVPEPNKIYDSEFSGKFNLRIPKSLHRDLVLRALDEDVSLNQLCSHLLSKAIKPEPILSWCRKPVKFEIPTKPACGNRSWTTGRGFDSDRIGA